MDAGKKVNGRKRHILVDTMGLLLIAIVHIASIQDRDGARIVLEKAKACFTRLRLIWADGANGRQRRVGGLRDIDTGCRIVDLSIRHHLVYANRYNFVFCHRVHRVSQFIKINLCELCGLKVKFILLKVQCLTLLFEVLR